MTTRINITQDGTNVLKWTIEDDDIAEKQVSDIVDILNGKRPTRPRRQFSRKQLQDIADAWHSAEEGERNKAIRDMLGVSSQDATNYISRCRALGLIEPSKRRRPASMRSEQTVAEVSFNNQFGAGIEAMMARGAEA